jgi:hypothetical protein|tara:strand:+ start:373 stop:480 length:108 start_codon:yes stop_codon:yes gene_type:complete
MADALLAMLNRDPLNVEPSIRAVSDEDMDMESATQ